MKAFLMYRDRNLDVKEPLPSHEQELALDLDLNTLFQAMTLGDKFLYQVVKKAVLSSLTDLDTIRYRQNILKDCLNNPAIVRSIYDITVDTIEKERKVYLGIYSKYPPAILSRSIEVQHLFIPMLRELVSIADHHAGKFESEGFRTLFAMLQSELNEEYFTCIQDHLKELEFRNGVWISAALGSGNKGVEYTLRKPHDQHLNWIQRILADRTSGYSFKIDDRDDRGARALSELKDRGINLVANALAQSNDHILSFLMMLRTELAFYVGCLNLYDHLTRLGEPITFPEPSDIQERVLAFRDLYDVCLALRLEQKVVSNDIDANQKLLLVITGANQGGKTTYLRSIGIAHLMMQSGMFVPAISFSSNVCDKLFTHFKREEDVTLKSGKLDEELSRMSDIADELTSNSMVLFNESFAATNEREGSEIADQIIRALLEKRVRVLIVTHLYEFARNYYQKNLESALFLRAERQSDGTRTFKLLQGEPLQTSFGMDVYDSIFQLDTSEMTSA